MVETPSVYCDMRAAYYLRTSYMNLVLQYVRLLVACLSPRVLMFRHGKCGGQIDTEAGVSQSISIFPVSITVPVLHYHLYLNITLNRRNSAFGILGVVDIVFIPQRVGVSKFLSMRVIFYS
jgi:hypothetical protein